MPSRSKPRRPVRLPDGLCRRGLHDLSSERRRTKGGCWRCRSLVTQRILEPIRPGARLRVEPVWVPERPFAYSAEELRRRGFLVPGGPAL